MSSITLDLQRSYPVMLPSRTPADMTLADMFSRSDRTLLYVYPADSTPGCTLEGREFTDLSEQFARIGVQIVGVSRNSLASHEKFMASCGIDLPLISDTQETLLTELGAIGTVVRYGKESIGVSRSSFLFDARGQLLQEWRGVKAGGHAQRILDTLC